MQPSLLNQQDLADLEKRNISRSNVESQLRRFEKGFPYLDLVAAADAGNGVQVFTDARLKECLSRWEEVLSASEEKIVKFVPASGAASRMFKSLYEYLSSHADGESQTEDVSPQVMDVLENLGKFAFDDELNRVCLLNNWKTISKLYQQGEYVALIENLLMEKGLGYGKLPKAMIRFHDYEEGSRTAAEEHLAEGALYAKNSRGDVHVHFTLSPEHIDPFRSLILRKTPKLEDHFSVSFEVTYSIQKSETDTIAVDMENQPLRDKEGHLILRPGGHGALIENLNDLDADIIFIKNIDNVVPDRYKCDTIIYKKALGGYLVLLRDKVYEFMRQLAGERKAQPALIEEIRSFLKESFSIDTESLVGLPAQDVADQLRKLLNRPMRVCGMVRNEGEPGGGPYLVRDAKGLTSLQILESTQIDKGNPADAEIMEEARYFNPVDLVCCVRDYEGRKYNLKAFVDEDTGFISHKSKDGVELKALELPGLWNGAMSGWNTAFVEVPASTFNPVKVVNDLLRPMHQ